MTKPGKISSDAAAALKTNGYEARKLPPHGYQWARARIGLSHGILRRFHVAGVIVKRSRLSGDRHRTHRWETADGIYEWVQDHVVEQDWTPCGRATGIRTIEPGLYTCTADECDCRMDRQTAREVLG